MKTIRIYACREVDTVFGLVPGGNLDADKVTDLIAWLDTKLKEVPAEYRQEAYVRIEGRGDYDGEHRAVLSIFYDRPESVPEQKSREERERADAQRQLADAEERLRRLDQAS